MIPNRYDGTSVGFSLLNPCVLRHEWKHERARPTRKHHSQLVGKNTI